jgi:hypothetical protein
MNVFMKKRLSKYLLYRECSLCIKVFRLKYGLTTIVEVKGLKSGITL